MRKQLYLSFLLFMLLTATGLITGCRRSVMVGGPCSYKDYEGVYTIKDIRPQTAKDSKNEGPEEKLYVSYTFKADLIVPPMGKLFPKKPF